MADSTISHKPKSTASLAWLYSFSHRRLALATAICLALETAWFLFAAYNLRGLPPQGWTAYAPLRQCSGCQTTFHAPPPYIGPVDAMVIYALPLVATFFLIAPSLARELESRRVRSFWTQAITRRQWLGSRVVPAVISAGLITAVGEVEAYRWIFPRQYSAPQTWQIFVFKGSVPVAVSLLLCATAILCALVFKRTAAVLLITAALFALAVTAISSTYPTLFTPKSTMLLGDTQYSPVGSLFVSAETLDKHGAPMTSAHASRVLGECSSKASGGASRASVPYSGGNVETTVVGPFNPEVYSACLRSSGIQTLVKYQPPQRYWELQWIYSAIVALLAAFALAASFVLVTRIEI